MRQPKYPTELVAKVIELHTAGQQQKQIAITLNMPCSTVRFLLIKAGRVAAKPRTYTAKKPPEEGEASLFYGHSVRWWRTTLRYIEAGYARLVRTGRIQPAEEFNRYEGRHGLLS
jgi:hypothetical protein